MKEITSKNGLKLAALISTIGILQAANASEEGEIHQHIESTHIAPSNISEHHGHSIHTRRSIVEISHRNTQDDGGFSELRVALPFGDRYEFTSLLDTNFKDDSQNYEGHSAFLIYDVLGDFGLEGRMIHEDGGDIIANMGFGFFHDFSGESENSSYHLRASLTPFRVDNNFKEDYLHRLAPLFSFHADYRIDLPPVPIPFIGNVDFGELDITGHGGWNRYGEWTLGEGSISVMSEFSFFGLVPENLYVSLGLDEKFRRDEKNPVHNHTSGARSFHRSDSRYEFLPEAESGVIMKISYEW